MLKRDNSQYLSLWDCHLSVCAILLLGYAEFNCGIRVWRISRSEFNDPLWLRFVFGSQCKRQYSSQFRVTVHTLLVLDTFHSASFVLSLPLRGIFRRCVQPRLPRMVVPVRLIFLYIVQTSSESIVSSTTTIHQHFLVWILRLDIYVCDKTSSEYLAVPRIDNRKFHNHIPYSTFHGIPVSVRRESGREGW